MGDVWELAHVFYTLGGVASERGNVEEARVAAAEALRLYEVSGDRRNSTWLQGNLSLVHARLGQFDQALQYNQRHVDTSRDLENRHGLSIALGNRADILLAAGRRDEAHACQEEALSVAEAMGNGWEAARHRAALAHLTHLRGEWDPAPAQFEEALPVLRSSGIPYHMVEPLLNAAELQVDRDRFDAAADLAREAGEMVGTLGLHDEMLRSQALRERIARVRG